MPANNLQGSECTYYKYNSWRNETDILQAKIRVDIFNSIKQDPDDIAKIHSNYCITDKFNIPISSYLYTDSQD